MYTKNLSLDSIKDFRNIIFSKETYSNVLKKITRFDMYIILIMKKYVQNKYLDILMPVITSLGNFGAVWIGLAAALMLNKRYKMVGIVIAITLILSAIIGDVIIKHLVRRIRPCDKLNGIRLLIKKPLSYSFPSGHTLSAFAVASVLSIFFTQYTLIFIGIAFLIALSRIYLYVHYPSDVIVGIIFGFLCSKLAFIIVCYNFLNISLLGD